MSFLQEARETLFIVTLTQFPATKHNTQINEQCVTIIVNNFSDKAQAFRQKKFYFFHCFGQKRILPYQKIYNVHF